MDRIRTFTVLAVLVGVVGLIGWSLWEDSLPSRLEGGSDDSSGRQIERQHESSAPQTVIRKSLGGLPWRVLVRGKSGSAVRGAVVCVHPSDLRLVGSSDMVWHKKVDASGVAEIEGARSRLTEGMRMAVYADGFRPAHFQPTTQETVVTLADASRVRIRVVDAENLPVGDAKVGLFQASAPKDWEKRGVGFPGDVSDAICAEVTDQDGRVEFGSVASGRYSALIASPFVWISGEAESIRVPPGGLELEFGAAPLLAAAVRFRPATPARVAVRESKWVFESRGSLAITRARVDLSARFPGCSIITALASRATLGQTGTECTLEFGGVEGKLRTNPIFLRPAFLVRDPVVIDYVESRESTAKLTVVVRDPKGREVRELPVELVEVNEDGGRVGLINLPLRSSAPATVKPGRYAILLSALGLRRAVRKTVEIPAGEEFGVELRIDAEMTPARVCVQIDDGSIPSYCVITVRSSVGGKKTSKTFRTLRPDRLDIMLPCTHVSFEVWVSGYPTRTIQRQLAWSMERQEVRLTMRRAK